VKKHVNGVNRYRHTYTWRYTQIHTGKGKQKTQINQNINKKEQTNMPPKKKKGKKKKEIVIIEDEKMLRVIFVQVDKLITPRER